jgi:Na+/alanine symporter
MIALGNITFCLATLIFAITFVASRNPKPPGWSSNFMIMSAWLPSIIGLIALGVSFMGFGFTSDSAPFTMTDSIMSLMAILLTIVVILLFKQMKKLKSYSLQRNPQGEN